jgi:hypothetical protein
MNDIEVAALRVIFEKAKAAGMSIFWISFDGRYYKIKAIPDRPLDPDHTGIKDFVAILEGGHIDLSNAEPTAFMVVVPLLLSSNGEADQITTMCGTLNLPAADGAAN